MRRAARLVLLALACMTGRLGAQQSGSRWTFTASAYLYPDADPSFLLPIVTADRGALHLEGRYNYEDLETVSGWLGWTVEAGDALSLAVTPMLGVAAGRTDGIAPGVELTLGWRSFELYSETEYLLPIDDGADAYLYTWTQATWSPLEWLSVGITGQRLRAADSELAVDRGPMAVLQLGRVALEAYVYNPFSDAYFSVVGASVAF